MADAKFEISCETRVDIKSGLIKSSSSEDATKTNLNLKPVLSIQEFIDKTKFDIDSFIIDKFWNNMHEDLDIYIDDTIINWMGYTGKSFKIRQNFSKLLFNFTKDKDYQILSNDEYGKIFDTIEGIKKIYGRTDATIRNIYPSVKYGKGKYQTKHILVKPDTFREIMMMLNTKKAGEIRKYYLSLEKLLKEYSSYQQKYREEQLTYEKQQQTQLLLESAEQIEKHAKLLKESQEKLKIEQERHVALREAVEDVITLEKNQIFYIATSDYYQRRNRYSLGFRRNPAPPFF